MTAQALRNVPAFDVERIRADFPILARKVYGKPLAYLDNAASAQKPNAVIEAEAEVYRSTYANVHRGAHFLSGAATTQFEETRGATRKFLNAAREEEVIFTRGATEAINLVATCLSRAGHFKPGDEIVLSELEHHSNIVPWHFLRAERGITIKWLPISDDGAIDLDAAQKIIGPRTKLLAVTHMSNALGTISPVAQLIALARAQGALVLIDGCQAAPHLPLDVQALGADFYVFSGHKVFGPSGMGVLWGRYDLLASLPPFMGGGEMIRDVTFDDVTYADPPHRFEPGTPPIAQVIAQKAAFDYLAALDLDAAAAHEAALLDRAEALLSAIPGVTLQGTARPKGPILSFSVAGIHAHDLSTILDREGVAVRAGHHCAQPLMRRLGVTATARASFAFYNRMDEADRLAAAIRTAQEIFA